MRLQPNISGERRYDGYGVFFSLDTCFLDDPRYVECGGQSELPNINNARLNLEKIKMTIAELDPSEFPDDLTPVVLHLREFQSFALWPVTQDLEFVQSGKISALESVYRTIDPKVSCRTILDRIRKTDDRGQAWKLVRHDWYNCIWSEETKQLGPYPQKAWDSFLSAHGIHERVFQEEVN